jgi:hypothetical protein
MSNPTWANLAIIDSYGKSGLAIATIFVTPDEVSLSGAWFFPDTKDPDISNVVQNRLVLSTSHEVPIDLVSIGSVKVDIQEFVNGARDRAEETRQIFRDYLEKNELEHKAYMAIPSAERKLLPKVNKKKLEPMFLNEWDFDVDLKNPQEMLRRLGKRVEIEGAASEMKLINQASRLVKILLEMWSQDERDRYTRTFIDKSFEEFKLMPDLWLKPLLVKTKE